MRELRYHEKKLLKKTDFYNWKSDKNMHKTSITTKYRLSSKRNYSYYEKLVGMITKLASKLSRLPHDDEFRIKTTEKILNRLYNMGIISSKLSLENIHKIPVSSFLRRRFLIVLKRLKFVETLKEGEDLIKQGHFMIGNDIITDPDFIITKRMEDHIEWSDNSKKRRKILEYKNQVDDFDLLN